MIPLFTLPLDQLRAEHVDQLVEEEMPEGQHVEFKRTLPARGGRSDPWLGGGAKIGDYARDETLAEAVAFANSGGGNLVLGIVESRDHPKRAAGVNPVPRCHELADRLRLMARDCIEPQLPAMEVRGIETPDGAEGAGVVLFRVPPSRLSPHRLRPSLHCYLRRADRTEEMTMVEVQDMSVRLARGGEAIKERLEESRQSYLALSAVPSTARTYEVGIRASVLAPGHAGGILIDKVYARPELKGLIERPTVLIDGAQDAWYLPCGSELPLLHFHPVLRGGQRSYREAGEEEGENRILAETIHSDGLIEFVYKHGQRSRPLYRGWVMAMVVNGLWLADVMRKSAGVPAAELIIDVELSAHRYFADPYRGERAEFCLKGPEDDRALWKQLGPDPIRLHPLSATATDEFPEVLLRVLNDLRNLAGWRDADRLEIEFEDWRRS